MTQLLLPASAAETEAKGFALSILTQLALTAIAPEVFAPLAIVQTAVGLSVDEQKYLRYLAVSRDLTQTLNNILDILLKAKQLGISPTTNNDIVDPLTRIAKALEIKFDDGSTKGLAQVIAENLSTKFTTDGVVTDKNVAEIFKILLSELSWTAENGKRFPLGESLGRAAFTGYMTPYPQDF